MKKTEQKDINVRSNILEQASKLFKIFGYQKLVMDDIARAVGKGRSTLYLYFKDKEEIFNTIIESEIKSYLEVLKIETSKPKSIEEKIRTFIKIKFDFRYDKANEYHILTTEMIKQPEILAKMRLYSDPSEIAQLSQLISAGVASKDFGAMSNEEVNLFSALTISSLSGIQTDALSGTNNLTTSLAREMATSLFLRALTQKH